MSTTIRFRDSLALFLYVLVSLGLDENDSKKTTLEVYRQYFEKPFVNATEVYYKMESEKFLSENSVTEYMKKVLVSSSSAQDLDRATYRCAQKTS